MCIGLKVLQGVGSMSINVSSDDRNTCLRKWTQVDLSICTWASPPQRQFRTLSRSSSPASASILCCHARQRGHTWQVSRANASFLRVRGRKRREKGAVAQSTAHSPHIGLYGSTYKSKCAAGSPLWAIAAARELFCGKTRHFRARNFQQSGRLFNPQNIQKFMSKIMCTNP